MTTLQHEDFAAAPSSVGTPLPGCRIELHDPDEQGRGEVVFHGPNVMMGYAETAADLGRGDECGGRLATGDLGVVDAAGRLTIAGRLKRMSKLHGLRINLDEIEEPTGKLIGALGTRPRIAFRTRSVEAVRSLVATGAGVALLPDLVYRPWSLEGDRIESRDISGALPFVQVGVVWRKGSTLAQPARDFIDLARAQRSIRTR